MSRQRYRLKKQSGEGVRFLTVVAPYDGGIPPEISAQIIGQPQVGTSRMNLKINAPGVRKKKLRYEIP